MKSIAIDTETTGLDPYHGCRAFVITTCDDKDQQISWETQVNPFTRKCRFSKRELEQFKEYILVYDLWYFQNPVFDMTFLKMAGCGWVLDCWDRVRDVGLARHLVNSGSKPNKLEDMSLRYLGVDITKYETKLKKEVQRAQGYCRRKLPDWRVVPASGKGSDPMLPSGGGWKADIWLLKRLAAKLKYPKNHPWWTLAKDYYEADSATTLHLGKELETRVRRRKLWKIYRNRLKLIPVNYSMQKVGMSLSGERTYHQKDKYAKESARYGRKCRSLARRVGADLELPKSGNNHSLKDTVFNHFELPPLEVSSKTGEPSLKAAVIQKYLDRLPEDSLAREFLINLKEKRSRDTAGGTYLTGYIRAWLPVKVDKDGTGWYVLHPSLNPTGTATLRWSSSNPNEQNISKKENFNLRYCFGPAPGREWWSMDAQNIELRIPGYESGESELIDLFENPDRPPYYGSEHLLNFSTVYPDIWEKELKEVGIDKVGPHCKKKYASTWYSRCKNGGFAVGYGAVERDDGMGTADAAFHRKGSHAKLKERFANKEKLNQYWIEFANQLGYVETIPDKYVDPLRGYPLECPRNDRGQIKPTIPLNYHVQGSAMWWMCQAMIRCHDFLKDLPRFHLIGQIHDELLFDFPKGKGKEPWRTNLDIVKEIKRLMEKGGTAIDVSTPVGVEYHPNYWSEGFSIAVQ